MKQSSYPRIRPFFFGSFIIVSIVLFSFFLYKDFTTPPDVMQPDFIVSNVTSKKKTDQEKAAYTVPPTYPKNIIIDKLGIAANIIPLGTLKTGAIDTPKTAWDAGWYSSSAQPGSGGAVVIDGHVNDALNTPGIFYNLHTLSSGDNIQIQRGDNTVLNYSVIRVDQTPANSIDMQKVLSPAESSNEGLNIITCGGVYDKKLSTYTDRVVVYAKRVE